MLTLTNVVACYVTKQYLLQITSSHHAKTKTIKQTNLILQSDNNKSETLLGVRSSSYSLAAVYQLTSAVNRRRKPAAINIKPQHPPTSTYNASCR